MIKRNESFPRVNFARPLSASPSWFPYCGVWDGDHLAVVRVLVFLRSLMSCCLPDVESCWFGVERGSNVTTGVRSGIVEH